MTRRAASRSRLSTVTHTYLFNKNIKKKQQKCRFSKSFGSYESFVYEELFFFFHSSRHRVRDNTNPQKKGFMNSADSTIRNDQNDQTPVRIHFAIAGKSLILFLLLFDIYLSSILFILFISFIYLFLYSLFIFRQTISFCSYCSRMIFYFSFLDTLYPKFIDIR